MRVSLVLFAVFWPAVAVCQALTPPATQPNSAEADFPQLHRYHAADETMKQQRVRVRVVFLGDSITDYWGDKAGTWFRHEGWINRGIGGQTTAQLLLREQDDALSLHPEAIVLEGGANDMRLGFTPQQICDRVRTLGELAQAHGVAVFVTTMTPVCDCFRPLSGLRTKERIAELNIMLRQLCREKQWTVIDSWSVLHGEDGLMRKELTFDGVHPNDAGYARLAPLFETALSAFR